MHRNFDDSHIMRTMKIRWNPLVFAAKIQQKSNVILFLKCSKNKNVEMPFVISEYPI